MDRRDGLKRPPEMGDMKRQADAQALTLRAQLNALLRVRGMALDDVATQARLDPETLRSFAGGASINPRWQEKLARWLDSALDG